MKSYKTMVMRMVESKLKAHFNEVAVLEELKQGEYSLEWKGYVGMNQIDGFICDTGATFYWDGSDYIEF